MAGTSLVPQTPSSAPPERYCQFGKRFLDGFGWIAPVFNNRLGDALNIEFVHEHLFLIEGDRVLKNIGYSEKGTRFSEEDFGKTLCSLEALEKNGYWLTGRRYHPEAASEALEQQDDGHYYSFFSNQCQDWADRLRNNIQRIEKERGLPPIDGEVGEGEDARFWKEKPPTVPGSVGFALFALLLGVGAFLAPAVAAQKSLWVLALFLVASGMADIAYALHSRAWSQVISTCLFALLNFLAGTFLLLGTEFSANWAGVIFAATLAVQGAARIAVALRSRPFFHQIGPLLAGLGLLIGGVLLLIRSKGSHDVILGLVIGANLIIGGASTLWFHWTASKRPN